jgi:hypothetical protein
VLDDRHSAKSNLFDECIRRHSAKALSPSPRRRDDGFSLLSTVWHSAKSVSSARKIVLGVGSQKELRGRSGPEAGRSAVRTVRGGGADGPRVRRGS